MVYERIQKPIGQTSSQKKHTPLVPPLSEEPTQASSQSSNKINISALPSKEERDAIKRKLFGNLTEEDKIQAQTQTAPQSTSKSSHKVNISALPSKEKRDAIKRKMLGSFTETNEIQSETLESSSVVETSIQAKLTIGTPGDKYEQEADKVAVQVVSLLNAPVTQQKDQNLQREVISEEEEKLQTKPILQLRGDVGGVAASPDLESSIQQARSGGQSLADNIRQPMEQAFGADFSGVKIHNNGQSDQLNKSIQAKAFTTGQDVFFRQGEYNPGSRGGQELIAHELTHVVQQHNSKLLQRAPSTKPQKGKNPIAQEEIEPEIQEYYNSSAKGKLHILPLVSSKKPNEERVESSASNTEKSGRAFLFEVISTLDKADNLIKEYKDSTINAQENVCLSLVINQQANKNLEIKKQLNLLKQWAENTMRTWKGPALVITPVVWEGDSIPFLRLRYLAATKIAQTDILTRWHDKNVWRRLGDDDISFELPNKNNKINEVLGEAENDTTRPNKMVSFGYNLTTKGVKTEVKKILEIVYKQEMELRQEIVNAGQRVYPIEPNTFYMLDDRHEKEVLKNWKSPEKEKSLGGQSKEGLKLYQAANEKRFGGMSQFFNAETAINTSAGKRNNNLVQYLNEMLKEIEQLRAINDGTEKKKKKKALFDKIDATLPDELSKMDQSYFNEKTAIENAKLMKGQLTSEEDKEIKTLVQFRIENVVKKFKS